MVPQQDLLRLHTSVFLCTHLRSAFEDRTHQVIRVLAVQFVHAHSVQEHFPFKNAVTASSIHEATYFVQLLFGKLFPWGLVYMPISQTPWCMVQLSIGPKSCDLHPKSWCGTAPCSWIPNMAFSFEAPPQVPGPHLFQLRCGAGVSA